MLALMSWEVVYTDQFGAWWETLSDPQQDQIIAVVAVLEERGPALGRPLVDRFANSKLSNLKELRVSKSGALRLLFVFDPLRQAVLLLGGDKTGRWDDWYRTAIPEAERLYDVYLNELREQGLLP
jgi:hypothetical protein